MNLFPNAVVEKLHGTVVERLHYANRIVISIPTGHGSSLGKSFLYFLFSLAAHNSTELENAATNCSKFYLIAKLRTSCAVWPLSCPRFQWRLNGFLTV